jgi:hypothetical protein
MSRLHRSGPPARGARAGFRHAADGTPIAFESFSDEESFPVPITFQDHSGLDSLEDQAREALAAGRPIASIVDSMLREFERENAQRLRAEAVKLVLAEILSSENAAMSAWALAFTCNLHLLQGLSGPEIAKRFGVRKQAFFQLVKQHRANLGLSIQVPNMRSAEARARMRARNFRHGGA